MIDEIPISAKGTYLGFADGKTGSGETQEVEIEETGPLVKRLDSKNWKTRCKAYEELSKLLAFGGSAVWTEYAPNIVRYISDSNPGAQEKGMDVLKIYLEMAPELIIGQSEEIAKAVIEKGVTSGKAAVKNDASNMLLDFFSLHRDNFEGFFSGVIFCINNKNVKVQAAGISSITSILSLFGAQKVPFKTFMKPIENAAGASNPAVRGEALNFYKECYRWVRDLLKPYVEKLKKSQQDELKQAFEGVQEAPFPTRWLKSEEHLSKAVKPSLKSSKLDVYDMADARDIFVKYNEKWVSTVLSQEKWSEKKRYLEELNNEANYPKLAEKNPIELVNLAKRLINDSNLQVMLQAIRLVGLLSKGQRKFFDSFGRQFFPVIIQKFKDKKTQVLAEATSCLDNLLFSISFESVSEDIKDALEDPNPLIKTNICMWIEKVVENGQIELKNSLKLIAGLCKKNTDDSSPEVRQCSFKLLGLLLKRYSEVVYPLVKDLPEAKLRRLEETEKTEEKKTEEKKTEEKKNEEKKFEEKKFEEKKEPKTPLLKKPPIKDPQTKTPQKSLQNEEDEFLAGMTAEEAETVISSLLPTDTYRKLKDSSWKEKQSGLQNFQIWLQENPQHLSQNSEAVLRFIRVAVKDWKENNFNVVKAAIELYKQINESVQVSKKSAYGILSPSALDKLSDVKLVEVYSSCIYSLAETQSPKFVVSVMIKGTSDCSKPKVVTEILNIISKIISDFGVQSVNLKEVIDYSKSGLNQVNPSIKKSAHSLTVLIYSFIGEPLVSLLTDIKESTLKLLKEDFSKTEIIPQKSFKSFKGQEEPKLDPKKMLEESIPRANIEKLITPNLIKKFSDNDWKTRKSALDEVESILDSNGRVLATGLEVLAKNISSRLVDPNKAVVRQALHICGKLANSLGSDCKALAKVILPPVITCLADKQNMLRQDALNALNKWAEGSIDTVIGFTAAPLLTDNPEIRCELLKWLIDQKQHLKTVDLKNFVTGTLACLQDRSAAIRNLAEVFFNEIVDLVGFESFQVQLKDIKPAVLNTLIPVFEKFNYKIDEFSVSKPRTSGSVQDRTSSKEIVRKKSVISAKVEEVKSPIKKSHSVIMSTLEISIINTGNKEKRLEAESKTKWSVEDIRTDLFERTKEQVKLSFSQDLFSCLYHADFKKQIEGVTHLQTLIVSLKKETTQVIDIIFKWTWFVLQENANTQLHKIIFEMLQVLINTLSGENYILNDVEASLFYPIICEKSGNSTFKTQIRALIHSSVSVYPTDKVFAFVLQGCCSKNTKSKVECLEELSSLIQDYGIAITQSKDIKAIVKYAGSPDGNVRAAAIQTMAEVYKFAGEKTWNMIGEVPDKIRDLFDQRFRVISGVSISKRVSSRESIRKEPASPIQVKTRAERTSITRANEGSGTDRELKPKPSLLSMTFKNRRDSFEKRDEKSPNLLEVNNLSAEKNNSFNEKKLIEKNSGFNERKSLEKNSSFNEKKFGEKNEVFYEKKVDKKNPFIDDKTIDVSKSTDFFNKRFTVVNDMKSLVDSRREEKKTVDEKRESRIMDFKKEPKSATFKGDKDVDISPDKASKLILDDLKSADLVPEESMLFESFKIEDPFVSEFDRNLDILKNGDISSKVDALVAINDLILNNFEPNKEELQQKANLLSEALVKVLISTFEKPIEDIPIRFAKYFLNVLHKVCSTKIIIKELTEQNLFLLVEQVMSRMLIEELEKMGEKGEGEMMIKTLNGTIIRLLDNSAAANMTTVLIRLLSKYRLNNKFIKMPSMIARCLMKIIKGTNNPFSENDTRKVLIAMHEYLIQIKHSPNEDIGVKTLKAFLNDVVKVKGNNIWQSYDAVRQHHAPDLLIEKWILLALNTSVNPFVDPPKPKLDQSVLDSLELLKVDYKAGIKKLHQELEKNPNIDLNLYLSSYNSKLASQVVESLKELKEAKQEEEDAGLAGYNFQEFQKRLTMMKQRYGITNPSSSVEINSTLTDLKNKVNSLLNKPAANDDQSIVNELRSRIQNLNKTTK